jgi:hypothetical protein
MTITTCHLVRLLALHLILFYFEMVAPTLQLHNKKFLIIKPGSSPNDSRRPQLLARNQK